MGTRRGHVIHMHASTTASPRDGAVLIFAPSSYLRVMSLLVSTGGDLLSVLTSIRQVGSWEVVDHVLLVPSASATLDPMITL